MTIKNRWIYAFETGYDAKHKVAKLVREYHADENGKLSFVEGDARPPVKEDDDKRPFGQPTPDVALPHTRQREHCHYVFIGTRGRLQTEAIRDIESCLAGPPENWKLGSIYKPVNLGDSLPSAGPKGPCFAPVIDPLTLGGYLNRLYRRALNWRINYSVPHQHNPQSAAAAIESRKYLLGSIMRSAFLPKKEDPFKIKPHLKLDGQVMTDFLRDHEISLSKAEDQIEISDGGPPLVPQGQDLDPGARLVSRNERPRSRQPRRSVYRSPLERVPHSGHPPAQ